MSVVARVKSWLSSVLRRGRMEQDLADEMDFHCAARVDDLVRRGLPHAEARRRARLEFGAAERYKEECRESRGLRLANQVRADLLYAARGFRRSPGFTALVVLSLAIGIGANTAMFSVVNGVLLRPLPYRDQDRLVAIREENPDFALQSFRILPPVNPLLRRGQLHSYEDMLAIAYANYQLIDAAEPEELQAAWATANLCGFLGVQPAAGRCFTPEEEAARAQVAILSFELWQRQFGGDPSVVGKPITLRDYSGNKSFTVIGILPAGFRLLSKQDIWMPLSESPNYRNRSESWSPTLLARLKPGVDSRQARAELLAMQRRMFPKQFEGAGGRNVVVLPMAGYLARDVKSGLTLLLGVVGLVLLITCTNVANLLLSRGAGRVREIAVRASLGAGRARVCRQLLTEALALAISGGALGVLLANWMLKGVKALDFQRIPRLDEIHVDGTVLAFTMLVSLLSGALFGLLPALRLSRVDLADAMKSGGAGSVGGRRQQRLMNSLVVFEVALCAAALMGAGLLINTFLRLKAIDPGFRSDSVLVASLNSPRGGNEGAFYNSILERVRSMPGVIAAGLTNNPPPYHVHNIQDFKRPGTADVFGVGGPRANGRVISPGYFQALKTPIVRGRDFDDTDRANSRGVAIISESMAKHYWPGQDPLGATIVMRKYPKDVAAEIVGVARDVRLAGLRDQPDDTLYVPYTQSSASLSLVIQTKGEPGAITAALKREIRAIDRGQTFRRVATMDQLLSTYEFNEPRFYMVLLTAYGSIALVLTTIGIGGLVAYSVSRRTREIGLRMSFGATRANLLGMFTAGCLKLIVAGLAIGMPASFAVTRFTRSVLYGVTPYDPVTVALVALVLGGLSLAACAGAALGAATVDPAIVLRHD